jgi:DNA-binding MarR family transcriptional regulator
MLLSKAIEPFAKFNPREVSCTTLSIFLAVGESPEGLLQTDIARKLGIPKSSVSRNCGILDSQTQKGDPGMGLVSREPWHADQRIKLVRLTAKGRELFDEIHSHLG